MDPISMNSYNVSNLLRISGLATGLDTDSMVQQLMKAASIPLDKLEQQKQWYQWQQEDLRDINTQLMSLRNDIVFKLKLQGTFMAKTVTSSNPSVATATAGVNAVNGTYTISVTQLAQAATTASTDKIGAATKNSDGTYTYNTLNNTGNDIYLYLKGLDGTNKQIVIKNGATINDVVTAINAQTNATGVIATYDPGLDRLFLVSNFTGANSKIDFSGTNVDGANFLANKLKINIAQLSSSAALGLGGNSGIVNNTGSDISLQLNGKTIIVAKGATVQNFVDAINAAGANVTASYDSTSDKVILTASAGYSIDFTGTGPDGMNLLNNTLKLTISSISAQGQDAKFTFNGVQMTSSTNNVTVAGINITLTGTSNSTTTLTVLTDVDKIYNTIKSFIDSYNDIITKINAKLTEKRYYDYPPLTSEQKQAMKDSDITLWEQKARSGNLANDETLMRIYYSMRNVVSSTVSGVGSLSSIGITTGQWYEGGKLYIDETKLRDAIATNPQLVMNIFTGTSTSQGIAQQLYDTLNSGIDAITQKAGSTTQLYDTSFIGNRIREIDDRIAQMQDYLNNLEQRYYAQFTQLEMYVSQMNSQSAWLSQQIGVMTK
ncbi:flagellar filament capping protein FliD [Thermoanaerobacter sp. RKWS2]|uniref:flagellar filament capping protein FliD n=1 Tax=Thermoanaerobacter sp. RKWS2 TaxID=2983842 RepID=UPI00224B093A|nr:flagellar filament capping protein FliD [Thermoanaerobacter sp. RKWS2]UZQ83496.1 flagellar filament capping protein FliD [Thermoanaerobacter sp. RKWS2]